MTQKDGSPEASEGPYWSEELLAVLVVGLGDETQARETPEGIIRQALSGRALQGISEEALASYLSNLYERIAESVQDSDVARRRSLTKKVEVVTEAARKAVAAAYTELSEELLEERVAMAEELAQKQRDGGAALTEGGPRLLRRRLKPQLLGREVGIPGVGLPRFRRRALHDGGRRHHTA